MRLFAILFALALLLPSIAFADCGAGSCGIRGAIRSGNGPVRRVIRIRPVSRWTPHGEVFGDFMFDAADDLRLKRVEAKLDLLPGSLLISERIARIESKLDQLILLVQSIASGPTQPEIDAEAARIKSEREQITTAVNAATPK